MATQRASDYPKSWLQASDMLRRGRGRSGTRNLSGVQTWLRGIGGYDDDGNSLGIAVIYRGTQVVQFWQDGTIRLSTYGYETPTTARRMNSCLPSDCYVYRKQWKMFLHTPLGAHAFTENGQLTLNVVDGKVVRVVTV